jgi:predicted GH43/DUF377 family glycosyl hydrolase
MGKGGLSMFFDVTLCFMCRLLIMKISSALLMEKEAGWIERRIGQGSQEIERR